MTFAEKYHEYQNAKEKFEEQFDFDYERFFCDDYDSSIEFIEVANDVRLDKATCEYLHKNGFAQTFINHKDKWETHYQNASGESWRVRYSTKVNPSLQQQWVEVENNSPDQWPKKWLDSGYVRIIEVKP